MYVNKHLLTLLSIPNQSKRKAITRHMKQMEQQIPIKSPSDEQLILEQLYKRNIKYYLIAKTIIETDIPFNMLTELKVKDLKGKEEISYKSKRGLTRSMPLSAKLQNDYESFLNKLPSDDYVFTGSQSGKKLHSATMQVAFNSVRRDCNLPYCLNMTTLHMTFLYHMLITDGNCARIGQYMHAPSVKYVYNYLSLPIPDNYKEDSVKFQSKLINQNRILDEVTSDTTQILSKITQIVKGEYTETISKEMYDAITAYQRALSEANYNYRLAEQKFDPD